MTVEFGVTVLFNASPLIDVWVWLPGVLSNPSGLSVGQVRALTGWNVLTANPSVPSVAWVLD